MSKKDKSRQEEDAKANGYLPEKYYVVDTSALLHAEDVFERLRQKGRNCIIIPFATWEELDRQKKGQTYENFTARNVMRCVKELQKNGDPSVMLMPYDFSEMPGLNKGKNDHLVIATAKMANKKFSDKIPVILVSNDINVQVLAIHYKLVVQDVKSNRVKIDHTFEKMPELNAPPEIIDNGYFPFDQTDEKHKAIPENGGAVCFSGQPDDWKKSFVAYRKGDYFRIVDPRINLFGVYPKSNNGEVNWPQHYAMAVLKDKDIPLVSLSGGAGTAKTFLAILAAFDQKQEYSQILISRMPVQLGDKDRLGFIPGELDEKLRPWLQPFFDNIEVIKNCTGRGKDIDEFMLKNKVELFDLSRVRGRSISKRFIIVDEIQNLKPEEVLVVATRAGEGTKIVLTGDFSLKQIDIPTLDEESNGLSVLIKKMYGSKMFAAVHLDQAIRSPLVQEILDRWKEQ